MRALLRSEGLKVCNSTFGVDWRCWDSPDQCEQCSGLISQKNGWGARVRIILNLRHWLRFSVSYTTQYGEVCSWQRVRRPNHAPRKATMLCRRARETAFIVNCFAEVFQKLRMGSTMYKEVVCLNAVLIGTHIRICIIENSCQHIVVSCDRCYLMFNNFWWQWL